MGQRCGLKHKLMDEDVVQVVKGTAHLDEGIGRFSQTKKDEPARIADRVKKKKLVS